MDLGKPGSFLHIVPINHQLTKMSTHCMVPEIQNAPLQVFCITDILHGALAYLLSKLGDIEQLMSGFSGFTVVVFNNKKGIY